MSKRNRIRLESVATGVAPDSNAGAGESSDSPPSTPSAAALDVTFTHERPAFREVTPVARPKNGTVVAEFEREFARYVGAQYAIALCNGTATLHTALMALGVERGQQVAVPPLTMAATTLAVLHAGAVPLFVDVDPEAWLMLGTRDLVAIPVSLYGAHYPGSRIVGRYIDDAAQTLRRHDPRAAFTSYSFQASKILALGEGGMLVTDDPTLAEQARMFSSLGYRLAADQPRINPALLKASDFARHHAVGFNYRMNDITAAEGLRQLARADELRAARNEAACHYWNVVANEPASAYLTMQTGLGPFGDHDRWAFAVAVNRDAPFTPTELSAAIAAHGGEVPYGAWRLTYTEPALKQFASIGYDSPCPTAERLQPRILQFQCNNVAAAEQNADALRRALGELT